MRSDPKPCMVYSPESEWGGIVPGVRAAQEATMDSETRNLQNDFFNEMRRDKKPVTIFLSNGKKLVGRLKSFDKFTLLLVGHHGEHIVFKHAISTVGPASRPVGSYAGESERREAQPAGRPNED